MIDVVFLLLVYFMVATEFRSGEEVYKLDLPDRSGAASVDPFELDEEPLRVEIRSRGPVGEGLSLSGASISVPGPYPQPMDFLELGRMLADLRVGGATGLFPEDHPVLITATGDTRWQHALAAFNAAASAGYVNVSFGDES
jgi:biopolymer transport protein ExbD